MKILGLDSSGLVASAAVVENDILLAEYTTNYKKTHSQTLLPMLDEIRSMIELDLESIDAIAIAAGAACLLSDMAFISVAICLGDKTSFIDAAIERVYVAIPLILCK